jgi:hypothetical protein
MQKKLVLERSWSWLYVFLSVMLLVVGSLRAADDAGLLSKQEVKNLIANAKTTADHTRLAKHFTEVDPIVWTKIRPSLDGGAG